MAKNPALTSSYKAPKSAKKIPKGDTGFKIVDKAFKAENEAETSSYIPPQSPIAIQPGDKGFEIVGKAYNKWLWTFDDWKKKKSKIINPAANWGMNAKPMTPAQIKKKMKHLYLKEEFDALNNEFAGKDRIILIGPPTVGKSTVAEELSKELDIEYVKLDKLQEEYGSGKEFELVKDVLSPKFKKYNTPSILDFGGGHVYNKGIDKLLSDYPNVFLLMPSQDSKKSEELLRKGNTERWTEFMDQIIQGLKSGKHKHTKEKELELINKLEKMKQGEGGKFDKEDLPNIPKMQGWGGLNMDKDWNKFVPLSKEEDAKNRDISKHIISVYSDNGKRRDKKDIVKDIIEKSRPKIN